VTTLVAFQPTTYGPFQFSATLDGQNFNCVVTWNLFRKNWYLNCFDLSNNLVFSEALVGSPAALLIQSLSWANNLVTVMTDTPHGFTLGQIAKVTLVGCSPAVYNGTFNALATGPSTFTYPLSGNPGQASVAGSVQQNANLAGGYFQTSTLVYRESSNNFEISP
jgi:hypothetical protein